MVAQIEGKTIRTVRHMSPAELKHEGWDENAKVALIEPSNGSGYTHHAMRKVTRQEK